MNFKIKAKGHKNVLSKHKSTFEITKDKELSLSGDCIIGLDIDKAIRLIRNTEEESLVVPNLMKGFDIDEIQAEYVAEIKLRHLNREYILKHTKDIEQLEKDIKELEELLASSRKIKAVIIKELENIIKKYAQPRRSMIIYADEIPKIVECPWQPIGLFCLQMLFLVDKGPSPSVGEGVPEEGEQVSGCGLHAKKLAKVCG